MVALLCQIIECFLSLLGTGLLTQSNNAKTIPQLNNTVPDFLHPPFAPTAIQQPRTLFRWLDINPLGGPLGRVQTYITIPAVNIQFNWRFISDIVAAFDFSGPNNFSLVGIKIPSNFPCTLCISYQINGVVYRYSLFRYPVSAIVGQSSEYGEIFYGVIIPYVHQTILKNFRIEFWAVGPSLIVSNPTPLVTPAITIYTSVLGIVDYRYGQDGQLVSPNPIITSFYSVNTGTPYTLPLAFPLNSAVPNNT